MSVEAISWALNLAPVPRDGGGKRNSACKAVLVGLANHAGPDGTGAFPSVRTLVRYTDLSERTVRTALDRLAAEGIIRPCDPAVIAAKIKRADQRPQGWDLAMHLIRDDLDEADLAALEPQFPSLTVRVRASAAPGRHISDRGVQPLHPAPGTAVDNVTHGVQPLHPAAGTGCNHRSNGVQPFPERGAAIAPEPSIEPSIEPSAAPAPDHGVTSVDGQDRAAETAEAGEFFAALGPRWLLTVRQRHRLVPSVAAALAAGWTPATLAEFAGANTAGVRNPYAVLAARLSADALPTLVSQRPPARPAWCGQCNQDTRRMERADGTDAGRCPRCHPLAAEGAGATGRAAGSRDGGLTQTAVSGVQTSARDAQGGHAPRAQLAPTRDGASLRPGRSWLWAAGTAGRGLRLGERPGDGWVSAVAASVVTVAGRPLTPVRDNAGREHDVVAPALEFSVWLLPGPERPCRPSRGPADTISDRGITSSTRTCQQQLAAPARSVGPQGKPDCGRKIKRPVRRRTKAMTLARRTKT